MAYGMYPPDNYKCFLDAFDYYDNPNFRAKIIEDLKGKPIGLLE